MTFIQMKPTKDPSAQVVDVSPELATKWLGHNHNNRNKRSTVIAAYARDMRAGKWYLTGEPVKFAWTGELLDGQHRLLAVIEADTTVPMLVVFHLPPNARLFMDSGIRRTTADALHYEGYQNTQTLATAARTAIAWTEGILTPRPGTSNGKVSNKRITNAELIEFIKENPDLHQAVVAGDTYRRTLLMRPVVVNVALWRLCRIDAEAAHEFFDSLANSSTNGRGDPRAALLNRLSQARRQRERVSVPHELGITMRAWNAWRKGEELVLLKVHRNGETVVPDPR